jgi:hypothetical protein
MSMLTELRALEASTQSFDQYVAEQALKVKHLRQVSERAGLLSRGGCQHRWHSLVNCNHGDSMTESGWAIGRPHTHATDTRHVEPWQRAHTHTGTQRERGRERGGEGEFAGDRATDRDSESPPPLAQAFSTVKLNWQETLENKSNYEDILAQLKHEGRMQQRGESKTASC